MAIHLLTLGGLRVHRDDVELDRLLRQRLRMAVLVYLAIEQRASREHMLTLFWPDSDGEGARHALRQSLYHLSGELDPGWMETRGHELRISALVHTDTHEFITALERGEADAAARLYSGHFLDGVSLLDNPAWEGWVEGKRAGYARGFRRACRDWVEARRSAGDLEGAVEAAQHWVRPDPFDDEAQHRFIQALAEAGERAEAIRGYEAYVRLLEAEGLRPLDDVVELVARLRTEPERRAASVGATAAAVGSPAESVGSPAEPVGSPAAAVGPSVERVPDAPAGQIAARRPPRRTPAQMSRRAGAATLLAALVLVMVSSWAAQWWLRRPPTPASTAAVAVLPFAVHGRNGTEYLGNGMVNLLGTALTGAASVRPIDPRAVFSAVDQRGAAVPDLENGRRLAAALGADLLVLGDIVQAGERLQIDAAVYRVGETSRAVASASVSGNAGSVFELVDRLAARLLAGLSDPSAGRLLRTAAVTTSSLPAFKAYLEGERQMRAGQFERAADALLEAIAYDSAFALAHYRLALTREWAPMEGLEQSAAAAARHAARLSPRDRALLEAYRSWRAGEAAEAERLYRTILARYPDEIEARIQLGEILFHYGPVLGHSAGESEEAWRRVLQYEPRNLFALPHLARLAALQGRHASLDSLLALFGPGAMPGDRRLLEATLLRALSAGDSATARALTNEVRGWEDLAAWRLAVWVAAFNADPAAARAVIRALDDERRSPGIRADLHWLLAALHLASGQVAAAQQELERAFAAERSVSANEQRWALRQVSDWYVATLPLPFADTALAGSRLRAVASGPIAPRATGGFENSIGLGGVLQAEPLRRYALGLLAVRLRENASADSAAAALVRLASSPGANALVRDLDRGLRARIAWRRGRAEEALALLESLENEASQGDLVAIPFVSRANERLLRAEVLEALGRDADALSWLESIGRGSVAELPFAAPAQLRMARIQERLGNEVEAARHYARFVELWRDADPQFQPLVGDARSRLSEIGL